MGVERLDSIRACDTLSDVIMVANAPVPDELCSSCTLALSASFGVVFAASFAKNFTQQLPHLELKRMVTSHLEQKGWRQNTSLNANQKKVEQKYRSAKAVVNPNKKIGTAGSVTALAYTERPAA